MGRADLHVRARLEMGESEGRWYAPPLPTFSSPCVLNGKGTWVPRGLHRGYCNVTYKQLIAARASAQAHALPSTASMQQNNNPTQSQQPRFQGIRTLSSGPEGLLQLALDRMAQNHVAIRYLPRFVHMASI